jgi:hypothetical protein
MALTRARLNAARLIGALAALLVYAFIATY